MRAVQLAGVDEMSGYEFEQYISWLLHKRGYLADSTPGSHDFGADLIAHSPDGRVAIKCKRRTGAIGRTAVSDVHTAMRYYDCDKSMVICNSSFSSDAIKLAKVTGTILVDREQLGKWIAEIHETQSAGQTDQIWEK